MRLNTQQTQEIDALSDEIYTTRRATVPALEELLFKPIPVLDHGFVRVVDYMGDDSAVVQAARVSYGKGTKRVSEDRGLIRYLMRHWHSTPFEMCELKLHVKLPIFVARQWIRHRTANVNEYSARYSILDKEFYIPEPQNLAAQSSVNNQGRETEPLPPHQAAKVLAILREDANRCHHHYEMLLREENAGGDNVESLEGYGLARELARMNLTLNYYTQWYWKIDLHNLMHFLRLRADAHAQYEIRVYAEAMLEVLKAWVPLTYEAFMDYRHNGVAVSAPAWAMIKRMLAGETVTLESSGLGKREWDEFQQLLTREEHK